VNVAEVVDSLVRVAGRPIDAVHERLDWLLVGGLTVEPVTEAIGREAGTLRAERYHRARNRLSMADCVALATARLHAASLATSDPELAITARSLGVDVIALPDSRGVPP
jgi:predicted nucleic acid-binding protein